MTWSEGQKALRESLAALKRKDYRAASGFLAVAENTFADDDQLLILREAVDLLIAVKVEINAAENDKIEIEEIFGNGQETEFR